MTPEEALEEAARSGQVAWLAQLLTRYECPVNGHLDVVRYIIRHAKDNKYAKRSTIPVNILAHAISGKHVDVVEFWFGLNRARWDLARAFIAAVGAEQHTLVDRICELHRRKSKRSLLVEVTGRTSGTGGTITDKPIPS
ncbi:hypothetical protein JG688_00016101 [Phytophthora aleatoria]|uniref:Uncharacterized protein n=1 Tax=Phytophthora aleatoria TaxID=2496075 RepID=A0A8J5ISD0_9STRA|nr:hypothetical protein JG688_00016101 [Phytophthora aleatoria]